MHAWTDSRTLSSSPSSPSITAVAFFMVFSAKITERSKYSYLHRSETETLAFTSCIARNICVSSASVWRVWTSMISGKLWPTDLSYKSTSEVLAREHEVIGHLPFHWHPRMDIKGWLALMTVARVPGFGLHGHVCLASLTLIFLFQNWEIGRTSDGDRSDIYWYEWECMLVQCSSHIKPCKLHLVTDTPGRSQSLHRQTALAHCTINDRNGMFSTPNSRPSPSLTPALALAKALVDHPLQSLAMLLVTTFASHIRRKER